MVFKTSSGIAHCSDALDSLIKSESLTGLVTFAGLLALAAPGGHGACVLRGGKGFVEGLHTLVVAAFDAGELFGVVAAECFPFGSRLVALTLHFSA